MTDKFFVTFMPSQILEPMVLFNKYEYSSGDLISSNDVSRTLHWKTAWVNVTLS